MNLTLRRIASLPQATLGVLLIDNIPFCVTLEDAWKENKKQISCIPEGAYFIELVKSPKFDSVYQVLDVPDRSHILIHAGNTQDDTSGCILLGTSFGTLGTEPAVLQSQRALIRFMDRLKGSVRCTLRVENRF